MGEIYIKSFLPFDRKLILVSDQLFLYKSRPNFPSIFTAMHLLINSIDTARDTSVKMFHSVLELTRGGLHGFSELCGREFANLQQYLIMLFLY